MKLMNNCRHCNTQPKITIELEREPADAYARVSHDCKSTKTHVKIDSDVFYLFDKETQNNKIDSLIDMWNNTNEWLD